jgi:hypothetical protein
MLTEPTHCGLCIMWRGLECKATIGVVHLEQTTLQTVPIHEDYVVVEVLHVYTVFVDEPLEYPPNHEVTTLEQAVGQRLQCRRCHIHVKRALHINLIHRLRHRLLVVHRGRDRFLPHITPHLLLLLLLLNLHIRKMFHSHLLLLILKNLHRHTLRFTKDYSIPTSFSSLSS